MSNYTLSAQEIKELKREKLDAIRDYHQDLIKDLGIHFMDFNMKMPFYDDKRRYVVGIFASEFKKEKGFFFELITRELDPLDKERKVYRVPPSSCFDEEYEINSIGSYLVPLEELRIVNPQSVAISKSSAVTSSDKVFSNKSKQVAEPAATPSRRETQPAVLEDAPYAEMTIRDYLAIRSGKPVSTKSWLNRLIQENNLTLPF